jgi:hypothetical protein
MRCRQIRKLNSTKRILKYSLTTPLFSGIWLSTAELNCPMSDHKKGSLIRLKKLAISDK